MCVVSTGRGVDLSNGVLEKFKQFSLDTGILPDNIAVLPKNGMVPTCLHDTCVSWTASLDESHRVFVGGLI